MAIIRIEPSGVDVSQDVQRALDILRRVRINAHRRAMTAQAWGFLEVAESDASRVVDLLMGSNVRASVRPR